MSYNNSVATAIHNNQLLNYVYKKADNLKTDYITGDLNPTHIFPLKGVEGNITTKSYNDDTFWDGTRDYFNDLSYLVNKSKPIFPTENNQLPDLVAIGLKNSRNARIIGTAIY